jgi:capsular exopolysaccharide synthesis family protein
MSKFYQALEKAEQDRTKRQRDSVPTQEQPPSSLSQSTIAAPLRRPSRTDHETRPPILESFSPPPDSVEAHLVSLLAPDTFEAEQYRALSYMIEQLHADAGLSVLAVSSPAVGDGKTTTAINLASALTQLPGARVLLADLDIRRPSLPVSLGMEHVRGRGIVDFVQDPSVTLNTVLRMYPPSKLTLMLTGPVPPTPYEILKSARLEELIEEVRQHYDYIVLDTPPLVPFPDCRLIERLADGFLVVVGAHRTPRKLVTEALAVLDSDKVVGVVFNRDDQPALRNYAYYTYDAYHQVETPGPFGRLMKNAFGLFRSAAKD